MSAPTPMTPDYAAALQCASIVGGQHKMPNEAVLFRRTRGVGAESWARLELYWLLHAACGLSLNAIGRALAGRDHTTISSGVKRIEEAMSDDDYRRYMEGLGELAKKAVALGALREAAMAKLLARRR